MKLSKMHTHFILVYIVGTLSFISSAQVLAVSQMDITIKNKILDQILKRSERYSLLSYQPKKLAPKVPIGYTSTEKIGNKVRLVVSVEGGVSDIEIESIEITPFAVTITYTVQKVFSYRNSLMAASPWRMSTQEGDYKNNKVDFDISFSWGARLITLEVPLADPGSERVDLMVPARERSRVYSCLTDTIKKISDTKKELLIDSPDEDCIYYLRKLPTEYSGGGIKVEITPHNILVIYSGGTLKEEAKSESKYVQSTLDPINVRVQASIFKNDILVVRAPKSTKEESSVKFIIEKKGF